MAGDVRAPELNSRLGWLNTDRPLLFAGELQGQVTVLDFWTYCCINCMHILPDLAYLEEKYRDEPVAFVGVHSAKFANEASCETIRAAILRYEIQHPVIIDENMKIWQSYAVRSWPTLVVVDSTGRVVGSIGGEGSRDAIDEMISQALENGRSAKTLAIGPLTVRKESSVRAASGLAFPGKILADADGRRLFIADSNHNRIVVAGWPDEKGRSEAIHVIGEGSVGRMDGTAAEATFHHPQGLALKNGTLYVADTENHLIRSIDLESLEVATVVGTGEMSNDRAGGAMGPGQGLNSPWDLAIEGSTLYVAMAGTHQIWRIDLPVGFARAFAGSGRENIVDGPTESAALAQPSGICIVGDKIYFADSEVSAVRGIDMSSEKVFTVIGEGLFSFGDVDGEHPKAKLQHPLGIDAYGTSLIIADTYNHKIKLVEPGSRSVRTLFGTGEPGASADNGEVAFFEPGGLSVAGDEIFVADTNNHRIVRLNLTTRAWDEIALKGLSDDANVLTPEVNAIQADKTSIKSDADIELLIDVRLPADSHLSDEAPWSIQVDSSNCLLAQHTGKADHFPLCVTIPASDVTASADDWLVTVSFAYCTETETALCVPVQLSWRLPISYDGVADRIHLATKIDKHAMDAGQASQNE